MNTELNETRLKRLRMRSWRRGMKEMDLILGPFADQHLAELTEAELDQYEILMNENDQDLYIWFSGQHPAPQEHADILSRIQVLSRILSK